MQTSVDRPRFRQDLVAEPIEDGGAKFIDVMDPDSGTLFRFFEVEYSLACAMDGQRDVAGIVKWAEEELGLKPNPNEIRTVIATLGDLGYLDRGAAAAAAAAKPTESPAAAKPVDDFLKPGVVAAKPAVAHTPAADLELGHAGTARSTKADELPRAPDLELGAPGTAAPVPRAPVAKVEDVGLGASGPGKPQVSDVSIDLADQVGIGVDDVKEAVRASQVMKAVEVPPELAAELESPKPKVEAKKPEPAPEPKRPEPKVEAKPEPKKPEPKPEPKKPEPRVEAKKPAEEKRPATTPPPAKSGPSGVLIALLVLVLLGAGAFLAYKYVFAKKSTSTTTSVKETPPAPPPTPEPPPVETAKLVVEQPAPEEIKPTNAGQVAEIVANDSVVKMGDPIAKLVGFKSLEGDVASVEKTVAKAKTDIEATEKERDAAVAAGNKVGQTNSEKKLEGLNKTLTDSEAKLGTKKAALDKFLIKAPAAGKVTAVAKVKAKITPTDVVATLTRDPFLVATFKKADGATQDAHVRLGIKGSEQQLACTVTEAASEGTKIACPKDAAPEGTEVTYVGVDPNAAPPPPPADPIETHDTGSAAGSAEAGSATPEADSDTKEEPKAEPAKKKAPARHRPRPRPAQPAAEETGSAPAGGETPPPAPAPEPAPAPAGSDGQ